MKIMEEIKPIDCEQELTINGRKVTIGKGNQHIIHLAINEKSVAQISFFALNDEKTEAIEEIRISHLRTLCNVFVKPLSKLLEELKTGSGFEISASLKIGK